MCRIHGHLGGDPIDRSALRAVGEAQRHGGPDAHTGYLGEGWALGNVRLAIQGVDDGAQPFRLGEKLWCVYNGMIYNHDRLRTQLRGYGHRFDGTCDGDVLLPLYERYGDRFTDHLSGMYAIAIVDARHRGPVLKLFTDPAGMKSLYYYRTSDGRGLRFASEIRALHQFPDFPNALDPLAIDRYLGGKAIWGPTTIYAEVATLPPGARLTFTTSGALSVITADEPAPTEQDPMDPGQAGSRLHELLNADMELMLRAEVPVCVITSGGLDSSYLTALAAGLRTQVATFNVAYRGDWPADERHYAADVARHCGTHHTQVELDPAEFPDLITAFVAHLDQPNNAPHSLPTYALFEAVRAAGFKVAITGDGADELFAGYTRFRRAATDPSPTWHRTYQASLATTTAAELTRRYSSDYRSTLAAAGGLFTDTVGESIRDRVRTSRQSKLETLLRFDQQQRFPYYILRRVDHLSMAHGVEARIPFLQPSITAFAHRLPDRAKLTINAGKAAVAAAARDLIPQSVLERPKQPFTLPIAAMMVPGQPLFDMVGDIVIPLSRTGGLFDPVSVKALFARQTDGGDAKTAELLWSLLILETWLAARGLTL